MELNNDRNWLLAKAQQEDNCCVSVGGLVREINSTYETADEQPRRLAFSRFIEMYRRRNRMSVESLAESADIDVGELREIEASGTTPEPRTIYKLSSALKVKQDHLMLLSGLSQRRDPKFSAGVVKFAARSEPMEALSPDEEEALDELVKVLAESTDGD
jgi:transcriptional regulator with XRE-family HTH domain